MRLALFYHSLYSDWNHGNAHFLRGVVRELQHRGHDVRVYEPEGGWSLQNLLAEQGGQPLRDFRRIYPSLRSRFYDPERIELDRVLDNVDAVLVHEWNEPDLVARIGRHRATHGGYQLLFHDTHHRSATAPDQMERYDLENYDGVLVFGEVIRQIYRERGWADRVWTWHEAADVRLFRPSSEHRFQRPRISSHGTNGNGHARSLLATSALSQSERKERDLVWIGNWGDGERTEELMRYLIEPVRELKLTARVHGVRYPDEGRMALEQAGMDYAGWIPNYNVPEAFAASRVTMHIPRRPYRELLHGVPTIRVFEALACGIPLVCLNWQDSESLFRPGIDYLVVDTPRQMTEALHSVLTDESLANRLIENGLTTIHKRHTCGHRVDELLGVLGELHQPEEMIVPIYKEDASVSATITTAAGVCRP